MKEAFLEHIELWLSGVGLLLIFAVPALLAPGLGGVWEIAAYTAAGVGLVHGVLFWAVRRRRERVREEAQARIEAHNESLERRVAEQTEQVRALAAELALAEQQERHRLSLVLHEDLQQLLFSIQVRVQALRAEVWSRKDLELAREVEHTESVLQKAADLTRSLAVTLSPPVLEGQGLKTALAWLALHVKEQRGMDVALQAGDEDVLAREEVRVLLFQLVRELLFDLAEQAGVERARLTLTRTEGVVRIAVESDEAPGRVEEDTALEGSGLARLRRRLAFFGGDLQLAAPAGASLRAVITAPADRKPSDIQPNPA